MTGATSEAVIMSGAGVATETFAVSKSLPLWHSNGLKADVVKSALRWNRPEEAGGLENGRIALLKIHLPQASYKLSSSPGLQFVVKHQQMVVLIMRDLFVTTHVSLTYGTAEY